MLGTPNKALGWTSPAGFAAQLNRWVAPMTPHQAESIINQYGAALARGTDGGIARKLSWLPCSVCKIRLAFFVYVNELISCGILTQKIGEELKGTYHALNQFMADADADTINDIHHKVGAGVSLTESDDKILWQFMSRMSNTDNLFEFNSYINECYGQRDNQDAILR